MAKYFKSFFLPHQRPRLRGSYFPGLNRPQQSKHWIQPLDCHRIPISDLLIQSCIAFLLAHWIFHEQRLLKSTIVVPFRDKDSFDDHETYGLSENVHINKNFHAVSVDLQTSLKLMHGPHNSETGKSTYLVAFPKPQTPLSLRITRMCGWCLHPWWGLNDLIMWMKIETNPINSGIANVGNIYFGNIWFIDTNQSIYIYIFPIRSLKKEKM